VIGHFSAFIDEELLFLLHFLHLSIKTESEFGWEQNLQDPFMGNSQSNLLSVISDGMDRNLEEALVSLRAVVASSDHICNEMIARAMPPHKSM